MSPYAEAAAPPPGRRVSPFQLCQAQKPVLGKPSGWAPFGEKTTYCALRLAAAVVLPKWPAAFTASTAIWWPVVFASTEVLSYQTPASAPPSGYPTCGPPKFVQSVVPTGTCSQYWVMTADHCSWLVPRPLNISCRWAAPPAVSVEKVRSPAPLVLDMPQPEPQKTRYTFGAPVVTPMPSRPPWYGSFLVDG